MRDRRQCLGLKEAQQITTHSKNFPTEVVQCTIIELVVCYVVGLEYMKGTSAAFGSGPLLWSTLIKLYMYIICVLVCLVSHGCIVFGPSQNLNLVYWVTKVNKQRSCCNSLLLRKTQNFIIVKNMFMNVRRRSIVT